MATVLFLNRTDLVRNSIIDGNLDTSKLLQHIKIAQEIDVQEIIGTKMYEGLTNAIIAGIDLPANARWKTILDDYIVSMLIWFGQANFYHSQLIRWPMGVFTNIKVKIRKALTNQK